MHFVTPSPLSFSLSHSLQYPLFHFPPGYSLAMRCRRERTGITGAAAGTGTIPVPREVLYPPPTTQPNTYVTRFHGSAAAPSPRNFDTFRSLLGKRKLFK